MIKFLRRFLNRAIEPSITQNHVPRLSGPLTAHQAWFVVIPIAKALDRRAELTLITSGLDIDHEGRSRTWEFNFYLPKRKATVMLSLGPETKDANDADIDSLPYVLTQRINQASSFDSKRLSFPHQFRDSPEVVAEFSVLGVDFAAGPGDMKLEGRILPSGDSVWVTYYWDQEYCAAFNGP